MVNVQPQPLPPKADPPITNCPTHQIPMVQHDDIVMNCPEEGCTYISLIPKLAGSEIPIYWQYCEVCKQTYPTTTEGVCTLCTPEEQNRWDQILN